MIQGTEENLLEGSSGLNAAGTTKATNGRMRGLCLTCDNSATCVYLEKRGRAAICCDLFVIGPPSVEARPQRRGASRGVEAPTGSSGLKGLCSDCENRVGCILAGAEGGVWVCEEYR